MERRLRPIRRRPGKTVKTIGERRSAPVHPIETGCYLRDEN
jgi:hypothetical protein